MSSSMFWACVVENPSVEQEDMVIRVVDTVERASLKPKLEGLVGDGVYADMDMLVHVPDAGVARELYEGFVTARDSAGSKLEHSEFGDVVERFVSEVEGSELDVDF